jgi:hypothetical protein
MFLLGAGAARDAGLPLVADLTKGLRDKLPTLHGKHGIQCAEFPDLFDALVQYDCEVNGNYERFFEWLSFLEKGRTGSFQRAVKFKLDQRLVAAVPFLIMSVKVPIWEIFRNQHQSSAYQPDYFAKLKDFVPRRGRLKVFTTNFDLSVEQACRSDGLDVTTGFDLQTRQWKPSLFQNQAPGINLYKLHGSLNWSLSDNVSDLENRPLVERYPIDWRKVPEFPLGPDSKLQFDEPFVSLYAEFHRALEHAKICIVMGHSLRDDHIREPIRRAYGRGMNVIDVRPSSDKQNPYRKVRMGAKAALKEGHLLRIWNELNQESPSNP